MKFYKLIIVVLLIVIINDSTSLFSQTKSIQVLKIADNTTVFGKLIPVGSMIYDIANEKAYFATSSVAATKTITTATELIPITVDFTDINYWKENAGSLLPLENGQSLVLREVGEFSSLQIATVRTNFFTDEDGLTILESSDAIPGGMITIKDKDASINPGKTIITGKEGVILNSILPTGTGEHTVDGSILFNDGARGVFNSGNVNTDLLLSLNPADSSFGKIDPGLISGYFKDGLGSNSITLKSNPAESISDLDDVTVLNRIGVISADVATQLSDKVVVLLPDSTLGIRPLDKKVSSSAIIRVSDYVTGGTAAARGIELRAMIASSPGYGFLYDMNSEFDSCTFGQHIVFFEDGSYINATGEINIQNTTLWAMRQKIFELYTDIKGFPNVVNVYPEWWGAKGDSVVANATINRQSINRSLELFADKWNNITVLLTGKTYWLDSTIYIPGHSSLQGIDAANKPTLRNIPSMKTYPFFHQRYDPATMRYLRVHPLDYQDMGGTLADKYQGPFWVQDWARPRDANGNIPTAYNEQSVDYRKTGVYEYIDYVPANNGALDRASIAADGLFVTSFNQKDASYGNYYNNLNFYKLDTGFYVQGYTSTNTQTFASSAVDYTAGAGNSKVYLPGHGFVKSDVHTPAVYSSTRYMSFYYTAETGDSITGLDFGSYGAVDCYVPHPDSVIFIDNITSTGGAVQTLRPFDEGMNNSQKINNYFSDGNLHALVIGHRAAGHIVSNMLIQPYTNVTYGSTVLIDIGSNYNVFNGGMMWDVHCDSSIVLRRFPDGSAIGNNELNEFGHNGMKADHTVNYSNWTSNSMGYKTMWDIQGSKYGYYNSAANRLMILDDYIYDVKYKHLTVNGSETGSPEAVFTIVSAYNLAPPVIFETQNPWYGSGDLDSWNFTAPTLVLSHRTTQTHFNEGFSTGIDFKLSRDTLPDGSSGGSIKDIPAGARIYARAETQNDSLNLSLNFRTATTTKMTIRSGGNIGIGTTDPDETLEVIGEVHASDTIKSDVGFKLPDGYLINAESDLSGSGMTAKDLMSLRSPIVEFNDFDQTIANTTGATITDYPFTIYIEGYYTATSDTWLNAFSLSASSSRSFSVGIYDATKQLKASRRDAVDNMHDYSTATIEPGKYFSAAVVFINNTTVEYYINGADLERVTGLTDVEFDGGYTYNDYTAGCYYPAGTLNNWRGGLSVVQFYSDSLEIEELRRLTATHGHNTRSTDLVINWHDDLVDGTWYDISGNGFDGTFQDDAITVNPVTHQSFDVIHQNGMSTIGGCFDVANDGTLTLPTTGVAMNGKVWIKSNSTTFEHSFVWIAADASVRLEDASTRSGTWSTTSSTATSLNVYDGGSEAIIENKLGSLNTVCYKFGY